MSWFFYVRSHLKQGKRLEEEELARKRIREMSTGGSRSPKSRRLAGKGEKVGCIGSRGLTWLQSTVEVYALKDTEKDDTVLVDSQEKPRSSKEDNSRTESKKGLV